MNSNTKRKRVKLECQCGTIIYENYRLQHEKAHHNGERMQVKEICAKENLFVSAKRKKKVDIDVADTGNGFPCSLSITKQQDNTKRDSATDKNPTKPITIESTKSLNGYQIIKTDATSNEIADNSSNKIEVNGVEKTHHDGTIEKEQHGCSSDSVTEKLQMAQIECSIQHDPGLREIRSTRDREALIKLGPHRPILKFYPANERLKKSSGGCKRFNSAWYKEYEYLEYSISKDAAFCFVCSLFPVGVDRKPSDTAWSKVGVRGWRTMKRKGRGRKNRGNLSTHFNSKIHKAAVEDYHHFIKEAERIDVMMSKQSRKKDVEEKE